ncbi:interleukin-31 receptor subunit alpha [Megalops cyprinoides]|uniref:interleukin-31 receptor subunit alpha n=1 Tax=Megalops cyprinoides TaxID=118141 RepID=UPI001864872F|nr:interleukin-31 receptor subunit alpha [Megalops cyprinoides]
MRLSDRVIPFILIAGVLSVCCWISLVNSEPFPERHQNAFHCFNYDHCHSSKEGVHDLDCYAKPSEPHMHCEWKSGRSSSNKMFTLFVEQETRKYCEIYENINSTSYHPIKVFPKFSMTAYVTDANDKKRNCTKAVFTGTPRQLVRCGPTKHIEFKRHSGQLLIQVLWVEKQIKQYAVKYRELNAVSWKEVESEGREKFILHNLTSSLSYEVQVQCVINQQCRLCPASDSLLVPRELTDDPVIEKFDISPQQKGKRLIVIHWKLANTESVTGYNVTVGKESGEFSQSLTTVEPVMRLTLSGSAYNVSIAAFNSAGTSPSAQRRLHSAQNREDKSLNGKLNITFNGSSTFNVLWNHSQTKSYCCYCVEWGLRGEKMSFQSMFHRKHAPIAIQVKDPLQPYKRYVFLLHTRPDKDTCNLKRINNSESTYGRAEAYVTEGTPISAPADIASSSVTSSSFVIKWSPVPDEHARGFLLGYIIHYTDTRPGQNISVVTVHPSRNNYTLSNLESKTVYRVQLSAFTKAGEGVRSTDLYIETKQPDYRIVGGAVAGVLGGIAVLTLVANLGSKLFKRAKKLFWPSIPNPGNSNAIQKIDGAFELEVLEPLSKEKLAHIEESDTSSLHIIEGRVHPRPVAISDPGIPDIREQPPEDIGAEEEEEEERPADCRQAEPTTTPIPTHITPVATPTPAPSFTETGEVRLAPPITGDYTTMELFQLAMPQHAAPRPPAANAQVHQPESEGFTIAMPDQDYVRQSLCHTVIPSHCDTSEELNSGEWLSSL